MKIRIAHVSPSNYNVPLGNVGPTVACTNLHIGFLKIGADVTLFGSKNSKVPGKVQYRFPKELNGYPPFIKGSRLERTQMMLAHYAFAFAQQGRFDVIQTHFLEWSLFLAQFSKIPVVIKMSNLLRGFVLDVLPYYNNENIHFVSISSSQASYLPRSVKNVSILPECINTDLIKPQYRKKDFFLYVGRLIPRKRVHLAIDACVKSKQKIVVIGKPARLEEKENVDYYNKEVKKRLRHKLVTYIPEVSHEQVYSYFRDAKALISPTTNAEPFGLVLIEALASGTPVIALKNSLTSEILSKEVSMLPSKPQGLLSALRKVEKISPEVCRKFAVDNYSDVVVARKYIQLYEKLLQK